MPSDPERVSLRLRTAVLLFVASSVLAACGSSGGSPGAGAPISGSARTAHPPVEVHPPGDIPDNQAFVAYAGSGFAVSVPEGWARSVHAGATVFSDKYNSITITSQAARNAPTPASARSRELPLVRASVHGFQPGAASTVQRQAGPAVLLTYRALSPVNPVTGKVANEAVERYEFWRAGREVVLTLAAPVGSDNVDPWRKVTDSLRWTGK